MEVDTLLRRLFDSPWTYFTLAGLLAIAAIASQFRLHVPSRPVGTIDDLADLPSRKLNVVFVVIDTLRADRLSAYGYERPTSPVLEDLARHGVRFARVEAQSTWTKASMASLWTGLFPTRSGVLRSSQALPDEATLPAELFKQAGYATAGIWRNGWVGPDFGFHQGFDTYLRPVAENGPEKFQKRTPGAAALAGTDEDITRAAIGFLETHGREPFFLYMHYMDVHQYAYDDKSSKLGFGTSLSDSYDASIHWVDRNLGTVLSHLEDNDLFEKTLVVVTADHGEAFREHGTEGHARSLYQEVMGVPFILALPFRLEPGVVVEPLVRNVDVWPTVLDLVGLPQLPNADGRSLVPAITAAARGEPAGESPVAFAYLDRNWANRDKPSAPLVSVVSNGRRLLLHTHPERKLELFDHATDPKEQNNIAGERPDWVAELEPQIEQSMREQPVWGTPREVEIDEMSQELLRALGYIAK
jgi:arylsulfatase A-like enzyme